MTSSRVFLWECMGEIGGRRVGEERQGGVHGRGKYMAMRLGAWWEWVRRREGNLVGSSDGKQVGHLLPLSLGL